MATFKKCEGYASETYGECKGEAKKRVLIGTLPFHLCEKCYDRFRKDFRKNKKLKLSDEIKDFEQWLDSDNW